MKNKKTLAATSTAFILGLGLGASSGVLTSPGEVVYMDGGHRVELSEAQALPVVEAFSAVEAWTGKDVDAMTCVLEGKRLSASPEVRGFDAWCSGKKTAKSIKDVPKGATLVGK